jgi:hypothetical protein
MKRILIITALIFSLSTLWAQKGCTDANAINYNMKANINDGSCVYEPLILQPTEYVSELPGTVNETSGIIVFNNAIWTHNDSGGEPAIFKLDFNTGELLQTIRLTNVVNHDIEDITQDDHYIYLGDFGNNYGIRKDLVIHKIAKSSIPPSGDAEVDSSPIYFSFADQTIFEKKNRSNNFDCEALVATDQYLYLFSKNWVDGHTKCYRLPKEPGTHTAEIYSKFDTRGLVTGADYNKTSGSIVLVGYENFLPIVWMMWDFDGENFFNGNKRRADFPYIQGAQTEGISFVNDSIVVISSEDSFFPPRLYQLNLNQIIKAPKSNSEGFKPFKISPEFDIKEKKLILCIEGLTAPSFDIEIYNMSWQKMNQYSFVKPDFQKAVQIEISSESLTKGLYFIRIKQGVNIGFQKAYLSE